MMGVEVYTVSGVSRFAHQKGQLGFRVSAKNVQRACICRLGLHTSHPKTFLANLSQSDCVMMLRN